MRIKFRFQFSESIRVPDKWPIKSDGVVYSLEGACENIVAINAVLLGQPIDLAPTFFNVDGKHTIRLQHEGLLPSICHRLDHVQCTLGVLLPIEIDTENYEVRFEAENAEEETKIQISKWGSGHAKPNNRTSFDIAIKGLLCDPWPEAERKAAQFYRRARQAINDRYYIDAFVNFYFFLERLYAGGKFKSAEVIRRFQDSADLREAHRRLHPRSHLQATKKEVPLTGSSEQFFEWIVGRRGFFQHQSDSDPNRWLHSTQEKYADEAFVMAEFSMSVYYLRNANRVFNSVVDSRYQMAAEEMKATIKLLVDVIEDDPTGRPVRRRVRVLGPGTRTTREMAREILLKAVQVADDQLISIRQITATVEGTNELLFSYVGPPDMSPKSNENGESA